MKQFYNVFSNEKVSPLVTQLTWSQCLILLPIKNVDEIFYYAIQVKNKRLTKRQLEEQVKNKEHFRLPVETRNKIIKEYSKKLTKELGKGYTETRLRYSRRFYYVFSKCPTMSDKLSYSHYCELIWSEDFNKINYYIKISEEQNLSVRKLRDKIKSKEYERLDSKTIEKLIKNETKSVIDFVKNPIIIKNKYNYEEINEKLLQKLILEDITSFMKELGEGFCFIDSEYKIKIGDRYNYIDLLLFNHEYNCFVVIELKVTELKKEHIGQIEVYMNYIDKNLKKETQDKTIGIIICRKDNQYIIEYCSDKRIVSKCYKLI